MNDSHNFFLIFEIVTFIVLSVTSISSNFHHTEFIKSIFFTIFHTLNIIYSTNWISFDVKSITSQFFLINFSFKFNTKSLYVISELFIFS